MNNMLPQRLHLTGLCLVLYGYLIFSAHAGTGPVVVTGVVTGESPYPRLANVSIGLYADKTRTPEGEFATDLSLGSDANPSSPKEGRGPWGVYCLICAHVDTDIKEFWVLADNDTDASHPRLARPVGPSNSVIRAAKVGDLVVHPITDSRLASDLDFVADTLAAVIETEGVRTYLSIFPQDTASQRVLKRGTVVVKYTEKAQQTELFRRVPTYFQSDILENEALKALVNLLLTGFKTHFI